MAIFQETNNNSVKNVIITSEALEQLKGKSFDKHTIPRFLAFKGFESTGIITPKLKGTITMRRDVRDGSYCYEQRL